MKSWNRIEKVNKVKKTVAATLQRIRVQDSAVIASSVHGITQSSRRCTLVGHGGLVGNVAGFLASTGHPEKFRSIRRITARNGRWRIRGDV